MSGRWKAGLQSIRSSYWFVPTVMSALAIALGATMIWIDARFGHGWVEGVSWYQQARPEGAREILSTIAGSMITVAGVVFSITIVALSYASSQYGPRVLTNFMTDRGNTVTLGTFVATFLYCLMVLRTIRGGEEAFVPQYAVIVAMLLAVCSIGVLIYFIHHVPQSIHINHVVARIGEQLIADTSTRFPTLIGAGDSEDERGIRLEFTGETVQIASELTGYIQGVDEEAILSLASKAGLLIRLRRRPGDFIAAGSTLAEVTAPHPWEEHQCDALQRCFTVGKRRTPESDLMFLVSELVEIAARALSPGINDPMTAVTCLDWLGAGGTEFARRGMPGAVRVDRSGSPRLIVQPDSFATFVAEGFGRLRFYAAKDVIASMHFLHVIGELAPACRRPEQIDELRREVTLLVALSREVLDGVGQRAVEDRAQKLAPLLVWEPRTPTPPEQP